MHDFLKVKLDSTETKTTPHSPDGAGRKSKIWVSVCDSGWFTIIIYTT